MLSINELNVALFKTEVIPIVIIFQKNQADKIYSLKLIILKLLVVPLFDS